MRPNVSDHLVTDSHHQTINELSRPSIPSSKSNNSRFSSTPKNNPQPKPSIFKRNLDFEDNEAEVLSPKAGSISAI